MEPQIRYVRSADGTRIAYASTGQGAPVVCTQNPDGLVSVEVEWKIPRSRAAIEQISASHTLIRIEARGRGLSDREVEAGTFEAHLSDTSAVMDAIGAAQVDLVGGSGGALSGMLAMAYAAAHPQRVRTLGLFGTTARTVGSMPPMRRAIYKLADLDFDFYKKVMALRAFGWDDGRTVAESIESVGREELDFGRRGRLDADVSDLLPQINCPVLVGHLKASGLDLAPMSESRHLAAAMSRAQLRVLDVNLPSIFDSEGTAVEALLSFLGEAAANAVSPSSPHGTAIILFADIVDSTALTERLGDAAFRARARELDDAMRAIIGEAGGQAIDGKLLGDGVLATFPAASQAIDAALRCRAAGEEQGLPLHLGLHAGDVIREQNNVYGGAVNIASRISGLSAPGEALVSDIVRGLARTSAGVTFEDRGEHALKGVAEPVRIYAVVSDGAPS